MNNDMRYVNALLSAFLGWCATVFVMGVVIGQAFDGIEGLWVIVPIIGVWGTSLGVAGMVFQNSLRRSRQQVYRQQSKGGYFVPFDGDPQVKDERCPKCDTPIPPNDVDKTAQ